MVYSVVVLGTAPPSKAPDAGGGSRRLVANDDGIMDQQLTKGSDSPSEASGCSDGSSGNGVLCLIGHRANLVDAVIVSSSVKTNMLMLKSFHKYNQTCGNQTNRLPGRLAE
ncbi:hypothetical protein MUK42_10864 [Musa troglodytarum]|uniref:Uncharacterized protein n=1 Tax=Musa troglodytarum TaxID=320322 RepID=A0A9E7JPW4_9LILI|nr:hypothetical protein MUK42_10864 [Musa troglodytarum]